MISSGFDLYERLITCGLLEMSPPLWWPDYGSFDVVVGAVLTQNSQWKRVEHSLQNLKDSDLLSLEGIAGADPEALMRLIQPSGLYKNKAKVLKLLCREILEKFGDFETFAVEVDREWLLSRKGIGPETADSILCYACRRPVMVVDAYTARLVNALGWEFEAYDELQSWCKSGMEAHFSEEELPEVFARYHGMIVEYVKANSRGKQVSASPLTDVQIEGKKYV
jgi:endonuclease-3 related protein